MMIFYIRSLRTGWMSNVDKVTLIPPGKETATKEKLTSPSDGDDSMIIKLGQSLKDGLDSHHPIQFDDFCFPIMRQASCISQLFQNVLMQSLARLTAVIHHAID